MSQRAHLILSWVIVALWAAVIFFMSAHTGSDFDGTGPLAAIKRWLVGLAAPVFGPDRVCDPADWLTDTLGAALGASAAVLALEKMLAKRQMG